MNNPLNLVREYFNRYGVQSGNDKILLACSGGVDSMSLLHICLELGIKPAIAHCNFNLRATESDEDEEFIRERAKEAGLTFHLRKFDTEHHARSGNMSIQMAARELRYQWFEDLMKEKSYQYLITAHHFDDSIETLLLNLGRGTGINGLKGIESRPPLLRPMAWISKAQILQFAQKEKLHWREDSSNNSDHYQRNYIRHHIIPALRKSVEGFDQGIKTSLENLNSDQEFFQSQMQILLSKITESKSDGIHLNLKRLRNLPGRRSILNAWLSNYGSWDLRAIENSLNSQSGRKFTSSGYLLLLNRDELILRPIIRNETEETLINENDEQIDYPIPLKIRKLKRANYQIDKSPQTASLDYEKLKFPLRLRQWKSGDRFMPLGMKNYKKLSDFFVDRKLSIFAKEEVWLLCSGEDIVWIVGQQIDERYKLADNTKTVYFARLLN